MSDMEALLKESGLKSTKQRVAILEILKKGAACGSGGCLY
jgi:Fe2+ or Zn2+ uptake regulation protein